MSGPWLMPCFLAVLSTILYYIFYRYKHRRFFYLANKLPGPPGVPVAGNIDVLKGGVNSVFESVGALSDEYGTVSRLWIGPRLVVFLTHPSDIELVLRSRDHIDKSLECKSFNSWLGNGLLISSGEQWKAHRKLIASTFHIDVLKNFIGVLNKNSQVVVNRLLETRGNEIDCYGYLSETTVEILLETVMGVNRSTQEKCYDYAMGVKKMSLLIHLRHSKFWLQSELMYKLLGYEKEQSSVLQSLHGLTKMVLQVRKANYKSNAVRVGQVNAFYTKVDSSQDTNNEHEVIEDAVLVDAVNLHDDQHEQDSNAGEPKRIALIDLLIEQSQNGVVLSDKDIQNQVNTIMFEGHDTTTVAGSFFLCVLAAREDIQDKCFEEMKRIFGDSAREATFNDTVEMKYLERCIMETLRLFPPVPSIVRHIHQELTLASTDLTLPADCTVVISTTRTHQREDLYKNPTEFNPDNFLPEACANRHYYSVIPFSAGPRSCVGRNFAMLNLKVLLSSIIRKVKVLPGPDFPTWKLQSGIILRRFDGFKIRVEPRISS